MSQKTTTHGTQNRSRVIDNSVLIDRRIFETNWKKLQGTELIFDENGKYIGKVKEHLVCNKNINFTLRQDTKSTNNNGKLDDIENENHTLSQQEQQQFRTQFLKRAILEARKKAPDSKSN